MAQDSEIAAHTFLLQTYGYYDCLMRKARVSDPSASESQNLGGHLFWAGELDETGRALTVAGNVAGAATLTAINDAAAQRLAVRDGVVDFLVNSLDEALRILKNEIRKRETVAVCVASPLEDIEAEMVERGVQPDVFREEVVRAVEQDIVQREAGEADSDPAHIRALVRWKVDRAPALGLPKLDAIALECLAPQESIARRWLLRSSRYLGRTGQSEHLVWSSREFAARMFERVRAAAERNELPVPGRVAVTSAASGHDRLLDQLFFGPEGERGAGS